MDFVSLANFKKFKFLSFAFKLTVSAVTAQSFYLGQTTFCKTPLFPVNFNEYKEWSKISLANDDLCDFGPPEQ